MTIPAYRLPPSIERGAIGGPEFKNVVQSAAAGTERRVRQWAQCRARYDIAYGLLNSGDPIGNYQAILHLFYAHFGMLHPFRFKPWDDFQASNELLGTGDGSTTEFQLLKTYDPSLILLSVAGSLYYVRLIVLPVASSLVMTLDGAPTTAYTLGDGGMITFTSAPTAGQIIRWSGEFDLPMRFNTDYLPITMDVNEIAQIQSIPIVEVLGEF